MVYTVMCAEVFREQAEPYIQGSIWFGVVEADGIDAAKSAAVSECKGDWPEEAHDRLEVIGVMEGSVNVVEFHTAF